MVAVAVVSYVVAARACVCVRARVCVVVVWGGVCASFLYRAREATRDRATPRSDCARPAARCAAAAVVAACVAVARVCVCVCVYV